MAEKQKKKKKRIIFKKCIYSGLLKSPSRGLAISLKRSEKKNHNLHQQKQLKKPKIKLC